MNDNYTRDLRENLDAVLDAVVDSGFVDRHKMGPRTRTSTCLHSFAPTSWPVRCSCTTPMCT